MKKFCVVLLLFFAVVGCAEHDPILPGTRIDIFDSVNVVVENMDVPDLSVDAKNISGNPECDYRQDSSNNIWHGDEKIFSGFSTGSVVKSNQSPICERGFVYTGLTTGEVIKINTATKKVMWMADVFRSSNMTGGAPIVDIIAHVGVDKNFVYAGGLGDAFCKLNKRSGERVWCLNISVPVDFIMVDDFAFVVGADDSLSAINVKTGKIYWKTRIKQQIKPVYENNTLTVGKVRINYHNGTAEK